MLHCPTGPAYLAYGNVLVIRSGNVDTFSMVVFPYSYNYEIWYRSGNVGSWATQPWKKLVTNTNLSENPALFAIDRKNEINLCNGFSQSNGIVTLNYRGAAAPITRLRISNGRGDSEDGISLTAIEVADVLIDGTSIKNKLGI